MINWERGIYEEDNIIDEYFCNSEFEGLGLIKGSVEEIKKYIPENSDLKIPHMGWNNLKINDEFRNDKILKNVNVENEEYVYYVHSYFAKTDMKNIVAYSEYGTKIPGIVKNKNVYGMQFHPEKSGDTGLKLLKNWGELVKWKWNCNYFT